MSVAVLALAPRRERWRAVLFLAGIAALWVGALAIAAGGDPGAGEAAHGHLHGHAGLAVQGEGAPHLLAHPAGDAGGTGLLALVVMWGAMMVAMMVPAEAPALAGQLRARPGGTSVPRAAGFFAGLLATWAVFSAVAALASWVLERRLLLDAAGVLASPVAGALLVGAIGAFQLTPQKRRCLEGCRARRASLDARADTAAAALAAGLRHGTLSLGSCALLMLVPFGLGGMRLAPMAAITALLVVEKLGRPGLAVGRLAGAALVGWSVVALAGTG